MNKFSFGFAAAMLGLVGASQAGAITLTFANGVNDTSSSSIANCNSPYTGLNYTGCVTRAFISDNVATANDYFMNLDTFGGGGLGLGEEGLQSAFSNSGWSVVQASGAALDALSGITLTVTNFSAGSYPNVGGIGIGADGHNITVSVGGLDTISQALIDQLVWIQGLEINYTVGAGADYNTANNYNVPDSATFNDLTAGCTPIPAGSPATVPPSPPGGNYCDPIYPYQYANLQFYDAPMGPWPNGSFRGIALLATLDTATNTITAYGGVSYGFDNSVAPEPGTWILLLAGAAAILFARRRLAVRG